MKKKKLSNNALFWILNISGWTILYSAYILLYYLDRLGQTKLILGLFTTDFVGFFVSVGLRYFYKRSNYQSRSILSLSLLVIIGSLIACNLWYVFDYLSSLPLYGVSYIMKSITFKRYLSSIWSHLFVMMLWSALYFGIKLWREWMYQKERTAQANLLAQKAQLQMLRYQLNPHFLFNSLNSIRALIDENQKSAKMMITELAEFLRYSLISKSYADVPLNNEIEAIRHYFAIEKIRYEDKLDVQINVDPLAEDYPVLSFLIHPLIENAIKYGMKTSSMPLKVTLNAFVKDETLRVEVCNSGKWIEPGDNPEKNKIGTGTGLENVHQRLENAFPNNYSFNVANTDGMVCVVIEITNINGTMK